MDPDLAAFIAEHHADSEGECEGCWDTDDRAVLWPCLTYRLAERAARAEVVLAANEGEPCGFVSSSSDDGYCACIKKKHPATEYHACQHGSMQ